MYKGRDTQQGSEKWGCNFVYRHILRQDHIQWISMRHICNILGFTNERGNLDLQSQSVFLSQVSSQPLHISNYTMVFNHGSFVEELAPVSLISDALGLATFC